MVILYEFYILIDSIFREIKKDMLQKKPTFIILSLCYLLFSLMTPLSAIAEEKLKVKMGIFQFSPMNSLDEAGEAAGIYIDLIEHIAQKEGWIVDYEPGTWDEGLTRVKNGNIDLMPSIAFSKARDKLIDFNHESVVTVWGEVYLRPGSGVQNILDFDGKTIAIMKGDISGDNFKTKVKNFNIKCTFIECSSHDTVLQQVEKKKALGGVVPNIFGLTHYKKYNLVKSSIIFSPFSIYFGAPDGKGSLLSTIDLYLKEWKSDKNSFYYETLNYWLAGEQFEKEIIPKWLLISVAFAIGMAGFLVIRVKYLKTRVNIGTHELIESEEKYRTLYESSRDAIMTLAPPTWLFTSGNPATVKLFRMRDEAEFISFALWQLSPPEQPNGEPSDKKAMEMIETAMRDGSHFFEWTHCHSDNTPFPAEVLLTRMEQKGQMLIQATIRDITERKQAEKAKIKLEEQLSQSQKMESIGTLAGGIAHDFNNILSPIMIHSEMAIDDLPPDSPLQLSMKEIYKAGERARDLVKQILTFSRKRETSSTNLKVGPILKETIKMFRSATPVTIEIIQKIETDNDVIHSNPTQIQQVILNLCTNAVHAMKEKGGILEIGLDEININSSSAPQFQDLKPGPYLKLIFKDTGHGIDEDKIKSIFEPYYTTKGVGEGTGMGLAMVHGIIKHSGGKITVRSEVGKGTTFEVILPRVELDDPIEKEVKTDTPKGSESILIVDDEEAAVKANQQMLEKLGYNVTAKTNSLKALETFKNNPTRFDMVITDMTMPDITGKDLAREMISIRPDIPVIICTGFSNQIDEKKAKEMGIRAFIIKPIVMRKMAQTIRDVLDKK